MIGLFDIIWSIVIFQLINIFWCLIIVSGPDISSSSVDTHGNSRVHVLSEKLNVRAMPDPQGLVLTTDHEQQHEQQNSAQNLRLFNALVINNNKLLHTRYNDIKIILWLACSI